MWNILQSNDAWNGWQCALVAQRCLSVCASDWYSLTNGKCIRKDSFPPLGDLKTISFSTLKASCSYFLTFSVLFYPYFFQVKKELNAITDAGLNRSLKVLRVWERDIKYTNIRERNRENIFFVLWLIWFIFSYFRI